MWAQNHSWDLPGRDTIYYIGWGAYHVYAVEGQIMLFLTGLLGSTHSHGSLSIKVYTFLTSITIMSRLLGVITPGQRWEWHQYCGQNSGSSLRIRPWGTCLDNRSLTAGLTGTFHQVRQWHWAPELAREGQVCRGRGDSKLPLFKDDTHLHVN